MDRKFDALVICILHKNLHEPSELRGEGQDHYAIYQSKETSNAHDGD